MDDNRGSEKSRGKMKTRPNILQGEHSIISLIVELLASSTLCITNRNSQKLTMSLCHSSQRNNEFQKVQSVGLLHSPHCFVHHNKAILVAAHFGLVGVVASSPLPRYLSFDTGGASRGGFCRLFECHYVRTDEYGILIYLYTYIYIYIYTCKESGVERTPE